MEHNITLSTEQLQILVKMVYLGDHLINGYRIEPLKDFDEMCRHFFTLAKDLDNFSDPETPEFPTAQFEEGEVRDFIDEYDNNTFWEELNQRITDREMAKKYTEDQLKKMDTMERMHLYFEIEDKVSSHLQEHGYDQIVIQ